MKEEGKNKIVDDMKFTEIQTMINLLTKVESPARKELTNLLWGINTNLRLLESEKSEKKAIAVQSARQVQPRLTEHMATAHASENFSRKNIEYWECGRCAKK
jgi:hypothetical protein